MNVIDIFKHELRKSNDPNPYHLVDVAVAQVPDAELRENLRLVLTKQVANVARQLRMEPIPEEDDPLSKVRRKAGPSKATYYSSFWNRRVAVNWDGVSWKRIGEMTERDWRLLADHKRSQSKALAVQADKHDALADLMARRGVSQTSELGDERAVKDLI